MTAPELLRALAVLPKAEKAAIVARLAPEIADASPGIEKIADVCGGSACLVRTRVPVWVLEGYRRLGWTEAKLLSSYPVLRAADLVHAWAYVDAHRDEIDEEIRRNETA